jgi:hypothetical protein
MVTFSASTLPTALPSLLITSAFVQLSFPVSQKDEILRNDEKTKENYRSCSVNKL